MEGKSAGDANSPEMQALQMMLGGIEQKFKMMSDVILGRSR